MQLHDTHLHLDILLHKLGFFDCEELSEDILSIAISDEAYDQLRELLSNHKLAIQATVSTENFLMVFHLLSGRIEQLRFLVGSHPEIVKQGFDLDQYLRNQQRQIVDVIDKFKGVVGIGECGLDYYYTQDPELVTIQKRLFESQIRLALDLQLPLIIHCREAFEDLFSILDNYPRIYNNFLIHCFTGGTTELQEVHKRGGRIGIGGIATYSSAKDLQAAIVQASLSDIMLETDLPFLSPNPKRGQVCLPQYVALVADKIAELKGVGVEQVVDSSLANTIQFFGLNRI